MKREERTLDIGQYNRQSCRMGAMMDYPGGIRRNSGGLELDEFCLNNCAVNPFILKHPR